MTFKFTVKQKRFYFWDCSVVEPVLTSRVIVRYCQLYFWAYSVMEALLTSIVSSAVGSVGFWAYSVVKTFALLGLQCKLHSYVWLAPHDVWVRRFHIHKAHWHRPEACSVGRISKTDYTASIKQTLFTQVLAVRSLVVIVHITSFSFCK